MTIFECLQREEFFYLNVFLKLLLGLLAIVFIINKSGKGNLAPTSAIDQVQNYVLGGIIGGVIYSPSVTILRFAVVLIIWVLLIIGLRRLKTKSHAIKKFVDGSPIVLIKHGRSMSRPAVELRSRRPKSPLSYGERVSITYGMSSVRSSSRMESSSSSSVVRRTPSIPLSPMVSCRLAS